MISDGSVVVRDSDISELPMFMEMERSPDATMA